MFVPSLSWQNDHFYTEMAQKDRFYSPMHPSAEESSTPVIVGSTCSKRRHA
jgi:hypothetical protein